MIIIHTKSGAWYITLRNAQHLHLLTSAWFFFVVFWNQILKNWVIVDDVEFYVTETQLVNSTTFQQRIGLEIFLTSFLHRHLHRFPHRFWEIKTEWNMSLLKSISHSKTILLKDWPLIVRMRLKNYNKVSVIIAIARQFETTLS